MLTDQTAVSCDLAGSRSIRLVSDVKQQLGPAWSVFLKTPFLDLVLERSNPAKINREMGQWKRNLRGCEPIFVLQPCSHLFKCVPLLQVLFSDLTLNIFPLECHYGSRSLFCSWSTFSGSRESHNDEAGDCCYQPIL